MREEGARSVFAVSHVGTRLPANAVALGKALLSLKTEPEIRDAFASRLYAYGELAALTPKTITSLDALLEDLERARQRGHAEGTERPWSDAAASPPRSSSTNRAWTTSPSASR